MNSPGILEQENHFDELILGVITQPMQTIDTYYTAQVSSFSVKSYILDVGNFQISERLFSFGRPYGTDLNSIDIQRARDHAVPGYPTILYGCTGIEVNDFDDLADIWPEEVSNLL